jgi:hypothetical protein
MILDVQICIAARSQVLPGNAYLAASPPELMKRWQDPPVMQSQAAPGNELQSLDGSHV